MKILACYVRVGAMGIVLGVALTRLELPVVAIILATACLFLSSFMMLLLRRKPKLRIDAPHSNRAFLDLEKLKEAMLDESAISRAEDAYRATLPAAEDEFDDTGFAEPMTEAVMTAFDWAVEEVRGS